MSKKQNNLISLEKHSQPVVNTPVSKSLLYQREDGTVVQCYVDSEEQEKEWRDEILAETPNAVIVEQQGHGVPFEQDDKLCAYWDAYKIDDTKQCVDVDMEAARDVRLTNLRGIRSDTFEILDKDVIVALGRGKQSDVNIIEKQKQKLRDLPERVAPALKKAKTLKDLNDIVPPELYA
jgi:hypothetical protein